MSNFMTLLTALLGSAGFALLFNVRKQLLPLAALGGALCWGAYLLAGVWTQSVFVQSFAASAVTAVWSEILARVKKTPAQQYLIVGLIPLVPGATLYYAMSAVVQQDWAQAQFHGYRVTAFVLGIAAGSYFLPRCRAHSREPRRSRHRGNIETKSRRWNTPAPLKRLPASAARRPCGSWS